MKFSWKDSDQASGLENDPPLRFFYFSSRCAFGCGVFTFFNRISCFGGLRFFWDKRNNFDSPVSGVFERNLVTFSRPFDSIRERQVGVPSVVKCCRWRQILPLSEASDEGDTAVHTGRLFHSHEKL